MPATAETVRTEPVPAVMLGMGRVLAAAMAVADTEAELGAVTVGTGSVLDAATEVAASTASARTVVEGIELVAATALGVGVVPHTTEGFGSVDVA